MTWHLWRRLFLGAAGFLAAILFGLSLVAYLHLRSSLPLLEGTVDAPGLSAPVFAARDAQGVPTLTGRSRADLAWGLGYLHAQERFFQMDTLRRSAAGELSDLVGSAALALDRRVRPHRFRHRARAVLARMQPPERQVLDGYVAGVNQGLADLGAAPFEYTLLWSRPLLWTAEDSILAAYAMFLSLQEADGMTERRRGHLVEYLGPELAEFLLPDGTSWDAPLDGSTTRVLAIPRTALQRRAALPHPETESEPVLPGSNSFAVGGMVSARGAGIVANDMHLGLRIPNVWFRARLRLEDASGGPILDMAGVTLPGAPNIVAGSNGRVAWGFTNSYVDTSDVVVLEPVPGGADQYLTPEGPRQTGRVEERLCLPCANPEVLTVEESVWGPVIGTDAKGRKLAYRWLAHDAVAIGLQGTLDLERATTVRQALAIAPRLGIPHQNLIAADSDGNVGWTVTGALPRRVGHDGRVPTSWADGTRGWSGYLAPAEVPAVYNPPGHRIWTANARVVGGEALQKLGFGGYAHGARARQIRDALFAREGLEERDLLAIQLDDRGLVLERWQELMLQVLRGGHRAGDAKRLISAVENWGGRAVPESIGYRLVRTFRNELLALVYGGYTAGLPALPNQPARLPTNQADEPVWRLIAERPAHLVPPPHPTWDAVLDTALSRVLSAIGSEAGGRLAEFTWANANRAAIRHPLAASVPGLSFLLDPGNAPQPGDLYQPRVSAPAFGASQRFVVAPGHESTGIFHMPGSQTGHPLSPYYNVGHKDWEQGRPTPFLPGDVKWQLTFRRG